MIKFEPANVTLLADGLGRAPSPRSTREHILGHARRTRRQGPARTTSSTSHYSGHGSQQPTLTPETRERRPGRDSLPADTVAPWDNAAKRLPNALLDDEIKGGRTALDAIRDKGAFVWIVVDACNSGSVTRAAAIQVEEDAADRKLDPTDPEEPRHTGLGHRRPTENRCRAGWRRASPASSFLDESEGGERAVLLNGADQSATSAEAITKGGMVAFFAAQTIETTPEMRAAQGAWRAPNATASSPTPSSRNSPKTPT